MHGLKRLGRLAQERPELRQHLVPILREARVQVRKAFSLPDIHLWAKDILYMVKGDQVEWLPKVKAQASGGHATITIPFRFKAGKKRWKDSALVVTVESEPGVYDDTDRAGPHLQVRVST